MLIFGWIILSIAVGLAAGRRFGRDETPWFILSLIISPLLAGILLLAVGTKGLNKREAANLVQIAERDREANEASLARAIAREMIAAQTPPRHIVSRHNGVVDNVAAAQAPAVELPTYSQIGNKAIARELEK